MTDSGPIAPGAFARRSHVAADRVPVCEVPANNAEKRGGVCAPAHGRRPKSAHWVEQRLRVSAVTRVPFGRESFRRGRRRGAFPYATCSGTSALCVVGPKGHLLNSRFPGGLARASRASNT